MAFARRAEDVAPPCDMRHVSRSTDRSERSLPSARPAQRGDERRGLLDYQSAKILVTRFDFAGHATFDDEDL